MKRRRKAFLERPHHVEGVDSLLTDAAFSGEMARRPRLSLLVDPALMSPLPGE